MLQPMQVDLSHISGMQYQEELAEMQNDESIKTLFDIKRVKAWLCEETNEISKCNKMCQRTIVIISIFIFSRM